VSAKAYTEATEEYIAASKALWEFKQVYVEAQQLAGKEEGEK
jgi:hypothetical protein